MMNFQEYSCPSYWGPEHAIHDAQLMTIMDLKIAEQIPFYLEAYLDKKLKERSEEIVANVNTYLNGHPVDSEGLKKEVLKIIMGALNKS